MDIKAIDTVYKGCRFRSRLEARWAVYFDCMGIAYEYEPEGFEFEDGTKYLPDFYLREIDAYVEIKSIGALSVKYDTNRHVVSMMDGREKADKYMTALVNIIEHHTYMILIGDPVDVLSNNDGASGNFWTNKGTCKIKAHIESLQYDGDELQCDCCGQVKKPVSCNPQISIMIPFIGFHDAKLAAISNIDEDICLIDKSFARLVYTKYGLFINDIIYGGSFLQNNFNAALRARQTRFEHGATDIPSPVDVGYRNDNALEKMFYFKCNSYEESIIGLVTMHPEYVMLEPNGGKLSPYELVNLNAIMIILYIYGSIEGGKTIEQIYESLHERGGDWKEAEDYVDLCEDRRDGLSTNNDPNTYIAYVEGLREEKKKIDDPQSLQNILKMRCEQ